MVGPAVMVSGRIKTSPVTDPGHRGGAFTALIEEDNKWLIHPWDKVPVQASYGRPSVIQPGPGQPNRRSVGHGCWTAPMDEEARCSASSPQWKRRRMRRAQKLRVRMVVLSQTTKYVNSGVFDEHDTRTDTDACAAATG